MKNLDIVDEKMMGVICKIYSNMDEDDIADWSLKNAEILVEDLHKYDEDNGNEYLPYDAHDFYDTIKEFIDQDYADM